MKSKSASLAMQKEYYTQTITIDYASGITGGVYTREVLLDNAYERCVGFALIPVKQGGVSHFRMGLANQYETLVSPTNSKMFESSPAAGLEIEKRFYPVNFLAKGERIKITTSFEEQLTGDFAYDIVFRLERISQKR